MATQTTISSAITQIQNDITLMYSPNYFNIPSPGTIAQQPIEAQYQGKNVFVQSFTGSVSVTDNASPSGTMTPSSKTQLATSITGLVDSGGQVQAFGIANMGSPTYMALNSTFSITTTAGGSYNQQICNFLTLENGTLYLNIFLNTPSSGTTTLNYNIWVKYTTS